MRPVLLYWLDDEMRIFLIWWPLGATVLPPLAPGFDDEVVMWWIYLVA